MINTYCKQKYNNDNSGKTRTKNNIFKEAWKLKIEAYLAEKGMVSEV